MTMLTGGAKAPDEYTRFCEGFRAVAKVDLLQYKRGQMERRVVTFVERRGYPSLTDLGSVHN